jgi:hypothetical protein
VKVEIGVPDDSLAVPMAIVLYVDRDARLQATLMFRPESGVPLKDCLDLSASVTDNARRSA